MARVITFSRVFPAYHPKKGEPTYFVEKIWKGLYEIGQKDFMYYEGQYTDKIGVKFIPEENIHNHIPKYHTIRLGDNWKKGDFFSPRVWSGKPYNSPMVKIAPDIKIEKTYEFEMNGDGFILNGIFYGVDGEDSEGLINEIAENDGLNQEDLTNWFKYPKPTGKMQIICWNKNIYY